MDKKTINTLTDLKQEKLGEELQQLSTLYQSDTNKYDYLKNFFDAYSSYQSVCKNKTSIVTSCKNTNSSSSSNPSSSSNVNLPMSAVTIEVGNQQDSVIQLLESNLKNIKSLSLLPQEQYDNIFHITQTAGGSNSASSPSNTSLNQLETAQTLNLTAEQKRNLSKLALRMQQVLLQLEAEKFFKAENDSASNDLLSHKKTQMLEAVKKINEEVDKDLKCDSKEIEDIKIRRLSIVIQKTRELVQKVGPFIQRPMPISTTSSSLPTSVSLQTNVIPKDITTAIKDYQDYAEKQVQGKSSLAKKGWGIAMIVLGVLTCVAAGIVGATGVGLGVALLMGMGGGALIACGIASLVQGRQKELSKAMSNVAAATQGVYEEKRKAILHS
jgi:hypothetical protein